MMHNDEILVGVWRWRLPTALDLPCALKEIELYWFSVKVNDNLQGCRASASSASMMGHACYHNGVRLFLRL